MQAEQRLSTRINVDIPAFLRHRDISYGGAKIKNINITGFLLQTDQLDCQIGALPYISFYLNGHCWYFPAMVVHASGFQFGMSFLAPNAELYDSLLQSSAAREAAITA